MLFIYTDFHNLDIDLCVFYKWLLLCHNFVFEYDSRKAVKMSLYNRAVLAKISVYLLQAIAS